MNPQEAIEQATNEILGDERLQRAILDDLKRIIRQVRVRQIFERSVEIMEEELKSLDEKLKSRTWKITELDKQIASKQAEYERELKNLKRLVSPKVLARLKGHKVS